jgi:hypothetical protein
MQAPKVTAGRCCSRRRNAAVMWAAAAAAAEAEGAAGTPLLLSARLRASSRYCRRL